MSKELDAAVSAGLWSWDSAVRKGRELVARLGGCTLDLVRELHAANKALSQSGFRSDRYRTDANSGNPAQDSAKPAQVMRTWKDYCEAIGIQRRTADRWLLLYLPDEDRLMPPEEFRQRLEAGYRSALDELLARKDVDPDWRPDGWCPAYEARYQRLLQAGRMRQIAARDRFDALDGYSPLAFDMDYYSRLSDRVGSYELSKDPDLYMDFCLAVESGACHEVPVQRQVDAYCLAAAIIDEFDPPARADVARFVADLLVRRAAGEFDGGGAR